MLNNEGQAASVINLSDIAARTATVTGSWIDVRQYEGDLVILQEVGTVSGTSPTLDGKIQDATDGSGTGAADVSGATFTQVTASNSKQKITIPAGSVRGWICYVGTIAGTTPSFMVGATGLSRSKTV